MHILDRIVAYKRIEVKNAKHIIETSQLEKSPYFQQEKIDLKKQFENTSGIIAEFKRKSPSKPNINLEAISTEVVPAYERASVSACSILTDTNFFGGSNDDLTKARERVKLPILRKDFIIDEYQILEAKSIGANIILLIAEILTKEEIAQFSKLAKSLNLSILLEIHSESQLDKYSPEIDLIGVNNRDLTTFTVDYQNSISLFPKLPTDALKISESGIHSTDTILELKQCGYDGFLIGERFMRETDPGLACHQFIDQLQKHNA